MIERYKIKEGHPIIEFIREEIIKYTNHGHIGICVPYITDRCYSSIDIYGNKFDGNNSEVPCLKVTFFGDPKTSDAPHIINYDDGFDYYTYTCSCTIKLKTFLEINPQWANKEEWMNPTIEKRIKCKYNGHNSEKRTVSLKRPDDKNYIIDYPEHITYDTSIYEWITPIEDKLTEMYYNNIEFDFKNNIRRGKSVWIDYFVFRYDYIGGIVEIYDILKNNQDIYKHLKSEPLITINIELPDTTKERIKKEIQRLDLEVKDIILVDYKETTDRIHVSL